MKPENEGVPAMKLMNLRIATALALLLFMATMVGAAGVILLRATAAMAGEAQVAILDQCDPNTFNVLANVAIGNIFCVRVGPGRTASAYNSFLPAGDPLWDFYPDVLKIHEGDNVIATNEGGENHTFTEVAAFGNGFIPQLNNPTGATDTIPECQGGFLNPDNHVAATRVVHGANIVVTGLKPGKHLFECCVHPWMRMEIDVGDQ